MSTNSNSSLDETMRIGQSRPKPTDKPAADEAQPSADSMDKTVKVQAQPAVESGTQPDSPGSDNQPTERVKVGRIVETQPTVPLVKSAPETKAKPAPSKPVSPTPGGGDPKPFVRIGSGFRLASISPWVFVAAAGAGILLILFGIALLLTSRSGLFVSNTPTPTVTPTLEATATLPPTPTLPPTNTPVPVTPTSALPTNTPRPAPTALEAGVLAQVTPPEGLKLKVRGTAGIDGALLGELEAGTQVKILEGPLDANGLKWWKIDNNQGIVGWAAEGSGGDTYLVPEGWAQ